MPLDEALVYAAGDTEKTQKQYDWMIGVFDSREDLTEIKLPVFDV